MPRSKLDFLAHLLETARNGTTREHLASEVNAHRELIDNSLSLLKNLNLLTEEHNSPVSFVTTKKGHKFLQDYEKLTKQISSDDFLR